MVNAMCSGSHCTESLGDGLERVVGDEAHEETRRRIRSAAPGAHLAAGFRHLGLGILGETVQFYLQQLNNT